MLSSSQISFHFCVKTFIFHHGKRFCHRLALEVDTPQYPPIIDATPEGKLRHQRQLHYDRIKELPTVDQKLHEIITKRNYFERAYIFTSCPASYLGAPFNRYITRTHVINELPQRIQLMNVDSEYESLKPQLCASVAKHFSNFYRETKLNGVSEYVSEFECGSKLANELVVNISRSLAFSNSHLLSAAYDPRSRVDSFWWHDGFQSKKNLVYEKNICFQFHDFIYFTIRIDQPLAPVVPVNDPLCATAEVDDYNFHPRLFGNPYERRYITSVPGFWPGDQCDFPLLQLHTLDRLEKLTYKLNHYDAKVVEEAYGVMASFGWLNALSTNQGFTPYNDLTYPLVGQTVLTNGQDWLFFVYQLNTITFHSDLDQKNTRNLCWSSGRMRLFDTIENGEIKGLNDEVLKTLLKLILHSPQKVDGIKLRPYLGEDMRTEEEIMTLRTELRKWFRTPQPQNPLVPEIPMWVHVYKRNPDATPTPWMKLK